MSMNDDAPTPEDGRALLQERSSDFRAPVANAIRRELDSIGKRLEGLRDDEAAELDRLGAFLGVAAEAGVRPGEIAQRAGVSRQTVVNLRSQDRGNDRSWDLGLRMMLRLGCLGPLSREALVDFLARGPVRPLEVEMTLDSLIKADLVSVLGIASSGGNSVTYYMVTAKGTAELPARLRLAAIPESRGWTAYVAVSGAEADAIARAGQEWLGRDAVVVIPSGTAHDMDSPEVGFKVEAASGELAQAEAVRSFRTLMSRAGMSDRDPIVVRALVPPSA